MIILKPLFTHEVVIAKKLVVLKIIASVLQLESVVLQFANAKVATITKSISKMMRKSYTKKKSCGKEKNQIIFMNFTSKNTKSQMKMNLPHESKLISN